MISCSMESKGYRNVFALVFILLHTALVSVARPPVEEDRSLHKQAIHTIKTEYGDIVDCIPIYKQPAFDHPLLQGHKIQMRPSIYPDLVESIFSTSYAEQIERNTTRPSCPDGTVPILRTKKQDLLLAMTMKNYGKRNYNISLYSTNGHESAAVVSKGAPNEFHGAKAQINTWDVHVEPDEFSASKITILGDESLESSSIQAGWIVHPGIFNDNRPRLYTYWTGDGFGNTGCFNIMCPGFVQVSTEIYLGSYLNPLSEFGGPQREIDIQVYKDPKYEQWWLVFANKLVGYWPTLIFKNFQSASIVEWGGEVLNKGNGGHHTRTQMGSGRYANEGYGMSSYFRNILVIDESIRFKEPKIAGIATDKPDCYSVVYDGSRGKGEQGYLFYYGGPGYGPSCL
ncbi:hypothetical protein ACHQM5_028799 [Ranunculus cassubicifolius]